jgi:hypothetical protein
MHFKSEAPWLGKAAGNQPYAVMQKDVVFDISDDMDEFRVESSTTT